MTTEEKVQIRTDLEFSMAMLAVQVEGLREDQWHFLPSSGGWSIAQIVEHVAFIESNIVRRLQDKIQTEAPDPGLPEATDRKEIMLMRWVPNRSRKAQMPSIFQHPRGTAAGAALLGQLQQARRETMQFVSDCEVDLRQYGNEHFIFKMLNGEQWLLLIALHAERHAAQIAEIKQTPDYLV